MKNRETYVVPTLKRQPNLRQLTRLDDVISPVVLTPEDASPCVHEEPL